MQDKPEEGELDPAVDDRRCCKNSPILSCIDKRTKEGCDKAKKSSNLYVFDALSINTSCEITLDGKGQ